MIRMTFSLYKKSRGWLLVIDAASLILMALTVPPASPAVVALFIIGATHFTVTFFTLFLRLRDSLFIGITVGLILTLNAYFGLNFLNTILLISFVLGLRFLVQ